MRNIKMKKVFLLMLLIVIYTFSGNDLFAQIQLITTIPGVPAMKSSNGDTHVLEFNNDDIPDISLLVVDPTDPNIIYVSIYNGANPNQKWEIPLPSGIIAILIGFYDIDGTVSESNHKEILVAEKKGKNYVNPVIIHSADNYETVEYKSFGTNTVFVATGDVNGDGLPEILIFDPDAKEVQIWGYR
jgi:hypothetical protein